MRDANDTARDRGFTLVELLIVIVILGILATVTVFAVRGISQQSDEVACDTELDTLVTAQEMQYALTGGYGDESALVTAGALKSESSMYDTTGDTASYSITAAAGSSCTGGASEGTPAAPPAPVTPPTVTMVNYEALHGVPAWRYLDGNLGSEVNQIIVFGRAGGMADWVAADDANLATSRRTHFISMDDLTAHRIDDLIHYAALNGLTTVVVFTDDDTGTLPGTAGSVADYVQAEIGNYPNTSYVTAQYGGGQLAGVLTST